MPPAIDHTSSTLSIYEMVRNRCPFVIDNASNQGVISNFTLELMHKLNACFAKEDAEIGHEENYTVIQQSIIADVIAVYLLLAIQSATSGTMSGTAGATTPTFLKMAKAGSVEVQYDQFDTAKAAAGMTATGIINMYRQSAISSATSIGCYICLFEDAIFAPAQDSPFKVIEWEI